MFKESKIELKRLAKSIRENKNCRKENRRGDRKLWSIESTIVQLKYHYRHLHIAVCELKGRTRAQIETPADNNKPNQNYIDELKKGMVTKYEETICISS